MRWGCDRPVASVHALRPRHVKPVITPEEAARLDSAAGDAVSDLMERAGYAVALAAARLGAGYGDKVVVLAGPGNNGGDGYVAARHLRRRGVAVEVRSWKSPAPDTVAGHAAAAARAAGVPVADLGAPEAAVMIIDALFGVGFRGELPESIHPWTATDTPVVAVDVPSGLDAATGRAATPTFRAMHTVTFAALKTGHLLADGPDHCGTVSVAEIGFAHLGLRPESVFMVCEEEDAPRPVRNRHDHKWSAGSVVVVGGSPGLTGAPLLAANAALTMGAGAVTLMVPNRLQGVYAAQAPGLMTRGVGSGTHFGPQDVDEVLEAASRFDVMVLGPGLGLEVDGFVRQLVLRWTGGLLLDADGLNGLPGIGPLVARQSATVLTPHAGEFARLTGSPASFDAAVAAATETDDVWLLKGSPTFVIGELRWAVTSGGPELATIGTGDVLAGVIAALWARGLDPETAALSGAYWHGRGGAELAKTGAVTAPQLATAMGGYAW